MFGRYAAPWLVFALIAPHLAAAQQAPSSRAKRQAARNGQATLVVSCDVACTWTLDGDDQQPIAAGASAKVRVDPGQHTVVAATEDGNDHMEQEAAAEAGSQEAVQFKLLAARISRLKKELAAQQERIRKFKESGDVAPQPANDETPQPPAPEKVQPQPEDKPLPATGNNPQPAAEEKPPSSASDKPQASPELKAVPVVQPAPVSPAASPLPPSLTVPNASQPTAVATPQPAPAPLPQTTVQAPQLPPAAQAPAQPPARTELSLAAAEQLLIAKTTPVYPEQARSAGVTGTVVLHGTITKDGSLADLAVVSGPEMLQKAAWDAVSKWKYTPYMMNGQPAEAGTTITMTFKLRDAPPELAPGDKK